VNIEKVRCFYENSDLHTLLFPNYMNEDWLLVPAEIGVFYRDALEEAN